MQHRACVAARDLTEYADPDADPATGNCTNPAFAYCIDADGRRHCAQPLDATRRVRRPVASAAVPVTVTLTYDFHLLAPLGIDFFGVRLGFPTSITLRARQHLRHDRHRPWPAHEPRSTAPIVDADAARRMVEFALVAPMFFLVLFGIIEAGRFIYYYETLNNATREGARYAIVNGANWTRSAARPARRRPGATPCDVAGNDVVGTRPERRLRCRGRRSPSTAWAATRHRQQRPRRDVNVSADLHLSSRLSRSSPCHPSPSSAESSLVINN